MSYMPYILPSTEGGVGGVEKATFRESFSTPFESTSVMKS